MPTRHRDALGADANAVVLTAHPDGCLLLYPKHAWEPVRDSIHALPSSSDTSRWWQRFVLGYAEDLELDAQGRILVSPALRKFAELKRSVVLLGQGNRFELWDGEVWETKSALAQSHLSSTPPAGHETFSL